MAIQDESNFPNSRITAGLQAKDADSPEDLLFIEGKLENGRASLLVSTESPAGFVTEKFTKILPIYTPTEDSFEYYNGADLICTIVATYTDATKTVLISVEREEP